MEKVSLVMVFTDLQNSSTNMFRGLAGCSVLFVRPWDCMDAKQSDNHMDTKVFDTSIWCVTRRMG